ncbi:bZIP transcription factor 11-like [Impatiens glandulifera]|uniref:bZIP transcription factor 11-like n=1 Tax=Impatiens glandulifera TaxID=253017 RepID=UPI001FB06B5F|nr:bZIP transcription factor 11-like [Impatiens glandulifera]
MDEMTIKKRKRMISNRESAKRSRIKRAQHMQGLANWVVHFEAANTEIRLRLSSIKQRNDVVQSENQVLNTQLYELQMRLDILSSYLYTQQQLQITSAAAEAVRNCHEFPVQNLNFFHPLAGNSFY